MSKHCPTADRDINKLMFVYTLPQIMELKEMIDIRNALEQAVNLDAEADQKLKDMKR